MIYQLLLPGVENSMRPLSHALRGALAPSAWQHGTQQKVAFLRSGLQSGSGKRVMPMKSGHWKSDNPLRTTNARVQASIERLAQAETDCDYA